MLKQLYSKFLFCKNSLAPSQDEIAEDQNQNDQKKIDKSITKNLAEINAQFKKSADYLERNITIGNVKVSFVMIEGMVNIQTMSKILIAPLLNEEFNDKSSSTEIYNFIHNKAILAIDMQDIDTFGQVFKFIMSGFVVIFIDKLDKAIVFGMQGFNFRSIQEPATETNEKGSRESFTEPLRINMTMVRRRIKSPTLKFELMSVGTKSKTDICLMYMTNKVSPELLKDVKKRIKKIKLDIILTSAYIQPFLEGKPLSLFSEVGTTERPDVLCGKINEGRIAIVIDSTPFALIVPFLFSENFQSLDDYSHRPYYATFIRFLKYFSFFLSLLLPGLYVGIGTFHPELLPQSLLFNIAVSEELTPFPLILEAIIIHFLFEIMREAGLRLPRTIGHAVSIAGAIVIGDAAVSAGLVGAPMILIIGMTAISAFTVPLLYEPVSILRLIFIIIGGTTGLYGITIALVLLMLNICSISNFGVPYTTTITPFSTVSMEDTFIRSSFKTLQKNNIKIQDLNGVNLKKSTKEKKKK